MSKARTEDGSPIEDPVLRFERLASTFVGIGADAISGAVKTALASIGELARADVVTLHAWTQDRASIRRAGEWASPAFTPLRTENSQAADAESDWEPRDVEWLVPLLENQTTVEIHDDDAPAPEAAALRRWFERCGTRAAALVVVKRSGGARGFISIETTEPSRRWDVNGLTLTRLLAPLLFTLLDRQDVEEASRRTDERYRLLAEASEDIVSLHGANGERIYVSPSYFRMTGYTLDEIVRTDFRQRVHPDDLPLVEWAREANLRGENTLLEYRCKCKDGSYRWLELRATALLDEAGRTHRILCNSRDITDRKRLDDARRTSDERYQQVVAGIEEGVLILDRAGNIVTGNGSAERILGQSLAQLCGRNLMNLEWRFHGGDESPLVNREHPAAAALRTGRVVGATMMAFRKPDGSTRWLSIGARPMPLSARQQSDAVVLSFSDSTSQVESERALRESEMRFRALADEAPVFIWVCDPGALCTFLNRSWLRFRGRTLEQECGMGWREGVHPDDADRLKRVMDETIRNRAPGEVEYRIRRHDGQYRWVLERMVPRFSPDGEFLGHIGSSIDITERKQLQQQLMQARKMEGIGRLAGGVAHDFNNWLTAILGSLALAEREANSPQRLERHLSAIREAAQSASRLTSQLLAVARKQVIEPKIVSIHRLLERLRVALSGLLRENIALTIKVPDELWPIRVDPAQFEQVILNLAVNARDAMPEGGTLRIECANRVLDARTAARHGAAQPGEYALLRVSDTGVGMDEATIEHAFEPFFTSRRSGQGTGLGLATVHGVVQQSGGYIRIRSRPRRGTTFDILLPRAAGRPQPDAHASPGASNTMPHATLLVVEDSAPVRDVTVRLLEKSGFQVVAASGPEEALRIVRQSSCKIDVLVTDVVMPAENGVELARKLRRLFPGVRVVFTSGFLDQVVIDRESSDPTVRFVPKPYTPATLVSAIAESLGAVDVRSPVDNARAAP